MLIVCLELIRSRLGIMNVEMRKLFFIILSTLIEKSPVSTAIHSYCYSVSNNVKVGSAGELLTCVHSHGTVISSGTVNYAVQGGSNFLVCG